MLKQKTLYLILAVACFIGIILIFVFDGYLGLYDSLTMNSGEQSQTITFDQLNKYERDTFIPQLYPNNSSNMVLSYEIDNRNFTAYRADITVSLWHNQVKVEDVFSGKVDIGAFKKDTVQWNIDTQQFASDNTTQGVNFTLEINRGDVLRKVIVYLSYPIIKIQPPQVSVQ
jgi:hypothetical protein